MSKITKETILEYLNHSNSNIRMKAIGKALIHLYNNQTSDEQQSDQTRITNGEGFTGCDARMGSSMARFYKRNGYLSPKQMKYWEKPFGKGNTTRIGKYWKQILKVANNKPVSQQNNLNI